MDAGFAKGILEFVPGRRKEAADAGDKCPHWFFWQHPCSGTCQIWRPGLEMQLLKPALTQDPACCIPTSCHFSSQNFLSNLCFSIPHCPFQIQVCVSWQWLLWVLFPPSQLLGNGNCDVPRAVQTHQKALTSLQESLQGTFRLCANTPRWQKGAHTETGFQFSFSNCIQNTLFFQWTDPVHVSDTGLALKSTGVTKKWESLDSTGLTSTPSMFSPFSATPTWHLPRAEQGSERDAAWFYCSNKVQEKNPETTQRNEPGRSQEAAGSD